MEDAGNTLDHTGDSVLIIERTDDFVVSCSGGAQVETADFASLRAQRCNNGAAYAPGHGLEGLRERIAGLRGMLVVDSPAGGPTSVGAHIPLAPVAS